MRLGRMVLVGSLLVGGLVGAPSPAAAAGPPRTIVTVAGGTAPGPDPATSVGLSPVGVAAAGGRLYVTDDVHSLVRRIEPDGTQTVVAGHGGAGFAGDGGPATAAALREPHGVAANAAGDIVITDLGNERIRFVPTTSVTRFGLSLTAGSIVTIAGDGTAGYGGDGGPGPLARLNRPTGVTIDHDGNVLFADQGNNRVRVLAAVTGTFYGTAMTAGSIHTIAGDGGFGSSGDGGPAALASLRPMGVAVDAAGNLLIADLNDRVRVVAASTGAFYGVAMTAGSIYTVAGTGSYGFGGDGGPATQALLLAVWDVSVDPAGNIVIADTGNHRVRVVAVTTGVFYGQAMQSGNIYTIAGAGGSPPLVRPLVPDGTPNTAALLERVSGVAVDSAGQVLLVNQGSNPVVYLAAATTGTFYGKTRVGGTISTAVGNGTVSDSGDGGSAVRAQLGAGGAPAVDEHGNLVIADLINDRVRVVAASTGEFYGVEMTEGAIHTVAGGGRTPAAVDGVPARRAALAGPSAVAIDGAGHLVIADQVNHRIRVVAVRSGLFYGRAMVRGAIYTVAGLGQEGFSGDGDLALRARLSMPSDVAVDADGNLVIEDAFNFRIRVVAAASGTSYGVAMAAGRIYTVAGGGPDIIRETPAPATGVHFAVGSVTNDLDGNVVFTDLSNDQVAVVARSSGTFYGFAMAAGDVVRVAGSRTTYAGPAAEAQFEFPVGLEVDGVGNLIIADSFNHRIVLVAAVTGTYYGVTVAAGSIDTIAGDRTPGFRGDGGPARSAWLHNPFHLAVAGDGTLYFGDVLNSRIRSVTR